MKMTAQKDNTTKETADLILGFLAENGPASRSDISIKLFKRNKQSSKIDDAIKLLLDESPPRIQQTERPRKNNGRVAKVYSIVTKKHDSCGFQDDRLNASQAERALAEYASKVRKLQEEYRRQFERVCRR